MRWSGRQAVAVLPVHFGVTNAGLVREELLAVIDRGARALILDMTATLSCDYAAADALARVYQRSVASGAELRLVIAAPVVRRVVALNGLDRLVPVFSALEAAEDPQPVLAAVLLLHPRAASAGSVTPALPRGPGPVIHLPVPRPSTTGGSVPAVRQELPGYEPEDALTRLTSDVLHAGHTLQGALDQPAAALRQAAEEALELLDSTIRDARTAVLARPGESAGGRAGAGQAGPVVPPRADLAHGLLRTAGEHLCPDPSSGSWRRSKRVHARGRPALAHSTSLSGRPPPKAG